MSQLRWFRLLRWPLLIAILGLIVPGCANVTTNFAVLDLTITATRAGQPVPHLRLLIWINERHLEEVTDLSGQIHLNEDFTWETQTLDLPGAGPLRHSPQPTVELRLANAPDEIIDGPRTATKEPKHGWKMTIAAQLPPN